jgi:hypothetical protein
VNRFSLVGHHVIPTARLLYIFRPGIRQFYNSPSSPLYGYERTPGQGRHTPYAFPPVLWKEILVPYVFHNGRLGETTPTRPSVLFNAVTGTYYQITPATSSESILRYKPLASLLWWFSTGPRPGQFWHSPLSSTALKETRGAVKTQMPRLHTYCEGTKQIPSSLVHLRNARTTRSVYIMRVTSPKQRQNFNVLNNKY